MRTAALQAVLSHVHMAVHRQHTQCCNLKLHNRRTAAAPAVTVSTSPPPQGGMEALFPLLYLLSIEALPSVQLL